MKKIVKIIGFSLGLIICLLVLSISISFFNHTVQLAKEKSLFISPGTMVGVRGHQMHVYKEGSGKATLVFMSGGGTSSPVLDFKSLYSLLSDYYIIAVVEKAGYGFSDDSNASRDIDTLLYETRAALSKAGLKTPYILLPHSMSGIEALYWAQQYPHEVTGIIGLDMTVPESYNNVTFNRFIISLSAFGSRIGITRFFPSIVNSSASIKNGSLSEDDKDIYRAVFYRRTMTKAMQREVQSIQANAQKVFQAGLPKIPFLFFISNGEGTGWDAATWINAQKSYIEATEGNAYIALDCSHYIHAIEYVKIAKESIRFIEKVIDTN